MLKFGNHILTLKSSTKTLYYEKSDTFAHLKVTDVILLTDPQLVDLEGKHVVKFNRALFEMLFRNIDVRFYLLHDYRN